MVKLSELLIKYVVVVSESQKNYLNTDKTSWVVKFRNCMCVLGEGVMREFLPDIRSFRGVVVFEHEDLNMAKESLPVLRSRN